MDNSQKTRTVTVLGIGRAGTRIVEILDSLPQSGWLRIGAADTDSSVLENSRLKNLFPVGIEWTHGLGCGGEVIKGERAFAHQSKKQIESFFEGASLIIVVGGLGGGTATGGASVLARMAKKMKIPAVFLVTTPFSFEGHSKRTISENGIKSLVQDADIVLPVPNDILYSTLKSDTSAEEAFRKANTEMARAIIGVSEIIRGKNFLSSDFSDLKSALNKRKTSCGIGLGTGSAADGAGKCLAACERVLESPLLGGVEKISDADVLFISVCGGENLNIGEIRQSLDILHRNSAEKARMIVGVTSEPEYADTIQVTLLAAFYDPSGERPGHQRLAHNALFGDQGQDESASGQQPLQGDLPLMPVSKGMFTNTSKNIVAGQDLDIPTFQRQGIHIDKGK